MTRNASLRMRVCLSAMLLVSLPMRLAAEPTSAAIAAFNTYVSAVEARLAQQHRSLGGFLAPTHPAQPTSGQPIIEQLTPNPSPVASGAMLHHWRGTAFAPGAHAADFDRLLHDLPAYPRYFAPQILTA